MRTLKFTSVVAVLVVFLCTFTAGVFAHDEHSHRHVEYASKTNPYKADEITLNVGGKLYASLCADCHGTSGRGDGEKANAMTPPPINFTDKTWKHGDSDGEIFQSISAGIQKTAMPAFKDVATDEDIWKIVIAIKQFSKN